MRQRLRTFWAPLGALFASWLWDYLAREHPELPMFAPSKAARLLTEHDRAILLGNRGRK